MKLINPPVRNGDVTVVSPLVETTSGSSVPAVAIVILSWNRRHHLLACLRSLGRLVYPACRVIVVDNGSADGSSDAVREQFPSADVIENGCNRGFAGGNNVGIAHALAGGAQYVLLLNDDTEVSPESVSRLVEAAESDPHAGLLGPKIYYYDQPDVIWSAGGRVDSRGEPSHLRVGERDDGRAEEPADVDYVTGCAILARRELIQEIGPLDERFFAYFEETEWCSRAKRAAYRVVYVPQAWLWHKTQPVGQVPSRSYLYLMARNRLLYLRCGGVGRRRLLAAVLDLLRTVGSWTVYARHRELRSRRSAVLLGLRDFALGRFGAPPPAL